MPIITITSDFGQKDPDIGHLKALILQVVPHAQLVDITHQIIPFDKSEAVYIIKNALRDFPTKTIHLLAIDSENYETQKPLLFDINGQYFLSNDNGLLATAFQDEKMTVYSLSFLENERFMQTQIKAAKKLSAGNLPSDFAVKTNNYKKIKLSEPSIKHFDNTGKVSTIIPKVIFIDNYGNAVLNLKKSDFEKWCEKRDFSINFGLHSIKKIIHGYNDFETKKDRFTHAGDFFARFNDYGFLEIFVYQSNQKSGGANTLLGLHKHQTLMISFL